MECPKCKLENPDSAVRCDCGYDFVDGNLKESYLKEDEPVKSKYIGICKVILPVLFLAVFNFLEAQSIGEGITFYAMIINPLYYILAFVFAKVFPNFQPAIENIERSHSYFFVILVVFWFIMGSVLDVILGKVLKDLKKKRDRDF